MQSEELKRRFDEIYEREIVPNLYALEKFRLSLSYKYFILKGAFVLLIIGSMIYFAFLLNSVSQQNEWVATFLLFAFIGSVFACYAISENINDKFRKKAKKSLLTRIMSVFGEFKITEISRISLCTIRGLGIYQRASRKDDDDSIIGKYKGRDVYLLETKLSHTEGSGKHRHTVIDFNGLIVSTKIKKNFQGKGVVYSKHDAYAEAGAVFGAQKREKVSLEDVDFGRQYDVIADDQVEIRYLLTPKYMERIKELKTVIGARHINLAFEDDNLYVFLNDIKSNKAKQMGVNIFTGKGLFEVGSVFRKTTDRRIYDKVFYELAEIFEFIDCINEEK